MAGMMPAIARRSSHRGRLHSCTDDQVVNIGVAIVVAAGQHVIVVIVSTRIAHACGNFVDQALKFFFGHIFDRFALASNYQSICNLVRQRLFVLIRWTNWMNADSPESNGGAGDDDLSRKIYVGMVYVANTELIQGPQEKIARPRPLGQRTMAYQQSASIGIL